jgi:hypothetical protein
MTSSLHGTAPSQQLAIRLPSHVGQGVNLGALPAAAVKPGRYECWQVGQIMDAIVCRSRVRILPCPATVSRDAHAITPPIADAQVSAFRQISPYRPTAAAASALSPRRRGRAPIPATDDGAEAQWKGEQPAADKADRPVADRGDQHRDGGVAVAAQRPGRRPGDPGVPDSVPPVGSNPPHEE